MKLTKPKMLGVWLVGFISIILAALTSSELMGIILNDLGLFLFGMIWGSELIKEESK